MDKRCDCGWYLIDRAAIEIMAGKRFTAPEEFKYGCVKCQTLSTEAEPRKKASNA